MHILVYTTLSVQPSVVTLWERHPPNNNQTNPRWVGFETLLVVPATIRRIAALQPSGSRLSSSSATVYLPGFPVASLYLCTFLHCLRRLCQYHPRCLCLLPSPHPSLLHLHGQSVPDSILPNLLRSRCTVKSHASVLPRMGFGFPPLY